MRISLGTKFQLKQTVLIFGIEFAQKWCFRSKAETVNTTIEFCGFELVYLPNFSLNWQLCQLKLTILLFRPNLSKKCVSGLQDGFDKHIWIVFVKPGLHCAIYSTFTPHFVYWKYFDECLWTTVYSTYLWPSLIK